MSDISKTLNARSLRSVAADIHSHWTEEGLPVNPCPPSSDTIALVQKCIAGDYTGPLTPYMYAAIIDAQAADLLLSKAEKHEKLRHTYQSASYRLAANRRLSEALSWLL